MQKQHEINLADQKKHLEQKTESLENELKHKNELKEVMENL